MRLALFGIDGGALSLIISLLVLFLVIIYLALIYWTYMDAKRRIQDPVLIACATAASVFPFVGTVVYTILRPPEFLEDREERELELRAAELRLRELIEQSCPHCEYPSSGNYLRCPTASAPAEPCRKRCSKPLDPKWGICPTARPRYAERAPSAPRAASPADAPSGHAARSAPSERRHPEGGDPSEPSVPSAPRGFPQRRAVRGAGHARRAPARAKRQPVSDKEAPARERPERAHAAGDPPEQLASRPVAATAP